MTAALYTPAPLRVQAETDTSVWVGLLPSGPITELTGIGPLLLEILEDAARPLSAAEATARMRELVPDAPIDAEEIVGTFLKGLAEMGILLHAEGAA